ncbi:MAG: tRNA (adenosine(37)-N6)-threonylcarbamoyltransferase complex transferase subunit TsaD, partial [Alphaproteobacteria bacterium]
DFADLDGVAATAGPGLIGAVMVGLMTGKAVAAVHDLPLAAVNHLEGHALSARLSDADLDFPYLLLLVSGGHCQLLAVAGVARYRRLGTTIDDAAGEAFDKAAKLLGLGYPGGPAIERAARDGDGARFDLPRPLKGRKGCDFSFSGLKTALLHKVRAFEDGLDDATRADLAASFQEAVADVVIDRGQNAIRQFLAAHPGGRSLVAAGGVAANSLLRRRLKSLAAENGLILAVPPQALCTDNAAMIAWAGIERLGLGLEDGLDAVPRARWPLDANAKPPPGAGRSGKLGPKA